jgi:hypothetical protein
MSKGNTLIINRVGFTMTFMMALLPAVYAMYVYLAPHTFALVRVAELVNSSAADWVNSYALRTLFVALIIGLLLFLQTYKILIWKSLFSIVIAITDAWFAFKTRSKNIVIYKYLATIIYFPTTFFLIFKIKGEQNNVQQY